MPKGVATLDTWWLLVLEDMRSNSRFPERGKLARATEMEDKTVSCMADSWAGVNNWSAESVGTAGGLRRSSTEDPASENSSASSQEANCSTVDVLKHQVQQRCDNFFPVRVCCTLWRPECGLITRLSLVWPGSLAAITALLPKVACKFRTNSE